MAAGVPSSGTGIMAAVTADGMVETMGLMQVTATTEADAKPSVPKAAVAAWSTTFTLMP